MRAVIQRVNWGKVSVNSKVIGQIESGLVVFLGVDADDKDEDLEYMLSKCTKIRIFNDPEGRMNLGPDKENDSFLVISQFTICGDVRKGRRPSWNGAANPEKAELFYLRFIEKLCNMGWNVESGKFQAEMNVQLENCGPVTILLDSKKIF